VVLSFGREQLGSHLISSITPLLHQDRQAARKGVETKADEQGTGEKYVMKNFVIVILH
jgi:hypothetical protein